MDTKGKYYDLEIDECLKKLNSSSNGLDQIEVEKRIVSYGKNQLEVKETNFIHILLRQITTNPLIIILAIATTISYLLGDHISSYYIFAMIILSIALGTWNEYSAEQTVKKLLQKISPTALLERNGNKIEIDISAITIGDIVILSTGSIIPADLRIIESRDLEINESSLTGESKPEFKNSDKLQSEPKSLNEIKNIAFMGTSVSNGTGKGVVIRLAKDTEFGKIAESASFIKPETEFEKGLYSFGKLIVNVILVLSVSIFLINSLLGHKILESLMFSLAIAVGLTPELLPVIVTVSLSHGAGKLAKKHVIAKKLISLENLGNMDILCTDKTGTLTEGKIKVVNTINNNDEEDNSILKYALLCNSAIIHHKIIGNGIDIALWEYAKEKNINIEDEDKKITEEPFNFDKKQMFSIVDNADKRTLITKGAPEVIISQCINIKDPEKIHNEFTNFSKDGLRVIAIAKRNIEKKDDYNWNDLKDLEFIGYITFLDTPKPSAKIAIEKLKALNVEIKIVTGDNELVTKKICNESGLDVTRIVLGSEIDNMSEEEFKKVIIEANVFARVIPEQKLKIIQTLQSIGHTVGYLGDGINDIPSLHAADVGISVNTAVDTAKESASIVLLRNGLDIITEGIIEGRRTFNNTIKYILMGTSSNFGNMFSAAGASFFLPFLPMTPAQILLTNGVYDISQLSIPSDNVDKSSLVKPRHWDINFIKNYMIFFGPISSLYDFLTFGVMLYFFHATGSLFQTGWFIESICTEILVVFVIRTSITPFYKSKPSLWLTITCLLMASTGIILPFTPLGKMIGLVTPPLTYFVILILIVGTYLLLVEFLKKIFLKKYML